MARLTPASTGGGGLGTPATRWALTAAWALGVLSDAVGGSVGVPYWNELLARPFGLIGALVLTTRGDQALRPGRAAIVAASAVLSATGALMSGAPLTQTWSFYFGSYLTALLIPRGNPRSGLVGGSLIVLLGGFWAHTHGVSVALAFDLLAFPLLALVIGATWRWFLGRIVVRELTHTREVERAAMAAEIAEASIAAIHAELAEIGADVGEILHAIGDGHWLDDEFATEISVVEASVRDRIRSPHLRDASLSAAIERARRRGVGVLVLGSSSHASAIAGTLATSVAEVIDGVGTGAITVRAIPAGRRGAVSVLRADDHTSERLVFDAGGRLLSRH